MQYLYIALILFLTLLANAEQFGYTQTSDGTKWIITSGSGLTITMLRSSCDIVSLKYDNQELQYKSARTQINSGLGSVTSSIQTLTDAKKTIQITCSKTGLTQYYFFRPNENMIYMGTYHSSELQLPELRFLARLSRSVVTSGITEATLDNFDVAVEAEDVVANSAGITRSKFYSGVPHIDDSIHGAYGSNVGVYFVMSSLAYETSIGGPFFRDINNKVSTANELTFYMNSDHTRTEDYRYGFHGPYALAFTDGAAPTSTSVADFSFFQGLGLKGFVDNSARGTVKGTISDTGNVLTNATTVGISNSQAQYWTTLAQGSKSFSMTGLKPGTYTMTVYKKQLSVATAQVTVKAGAIATQNIQVKPFQNAVWTIGEWDGTPDGFLNADKIHRMHPSDTRMSPWKPITFTVGSSKDIDFPMALFRGVNAPLTITFSLTKAQATTSRVLRIGVTLAQMSARPVIAVNNRWTSPTPATKAVATRGITRGVTVGNYIIYEYTIPATALATGKNNIVVTVASGVTDAPQTFLHACVVFDAIELI